MMRTMVAEIVIMNTNQHRGRAPDPGTPATVSGWAEGPLLRGLPLGRGTEGPPGLRARGLLDSWPVAIPGGTMML